MVENEKIFICLSHMRSNGTIITRIHTHTEWPVAVLFMDIPTQLNWDTCASHG